MLIPTVVVLFVLANMLFMIHEHIRINYSGSLFERWDKGFKRPWFKNNSRPDLKKKFPWFPFIWDGYHSAGWFMQFMYWMMFAVAIYPQIKNILAISYLGIWMAILGLIVHNITFSWFFKNKD